MMMSAAEFIIIFERMTMMCFENGIEGISPLLLLLPYETATHKPPYQIFNTYTARQLPPLLLSISVPLPPIMGALRGGGGGEAAAMDVGIQV